MDKIEIVLSDGYKLIAERNTGEFDQELYVGIERPDGLYMQDLAVIRPTYKLENNDVKFGSDKFQVLVYANNKTEDYSDEFTIERVQEDE